MEDLAKSTKSKKTSEKTDEGADIAKNPEEQGIEEVAASPTDLGSEDTEAAQKPDDTVESADATETSAEDTQPSDDGASQVDATPDANAEGETGTIDAQPNDDIDVIEENPSQVDATPEADAADEQPKDTDTTVGAASEDGVDKSAADEALDIDDKQDAAVTADNEIEKTPELEKAAQQPTTIIEQKSASIWPGVFGGLIAAMLGFVAGKSDQFNDYLPSFMQSETVDISGIEEQAATLEEQTATLADANAAQAARIAALESAEPVEAGVDLSAEVASLEASMAALADRVQSLEDRPIVTPGPEGASSEDLTALQSAIDAQNAEIDALAARAEEAEAKAAGEAARILARAALTRVVTAVDSGGSYAPALTDLEDVTPVEIPQTLIEKAETGVPTMNELRETFPEAARAGLKAAWSETPESEVEGITGFLKRQLSARSVVPKEGDDPDAILSRAEAAVKAGDLGTALTEMEALPETARSAMDEWLQAASARKAAQDAAQELADSLNSN